MLSPGPGYSTNCKSKIVYAACPVRLEGGIGGLAHSALVLAFVVFSLLPLRIFENVWIKQAFAVINPRITLPSHQVVTHWIKGLDEWHVGKIAEQISLFKGKQRCVLEFDCWPAPNGDHYIGVLVPVAQDILPLRLYRTAQPTPAGTMTLNKPKSHPLLVVDTPNYSPSCGLHRTDGSSIKV